MNSCRLKQYAAVCPRPAALLLALCLLYALWPAATGTMPGGLTALGASAETCTVTYILNGSVVATASAQPGSTVSKPTVAARDLRITGGKRTITGWYLDTSYATEWNFSKDVVRGNMNLYADWKTTYTTGTNRTTADNEGIPQLQQVSATLSGNTVYLSAEVEGNADLFSYQWQQLNENNVWTTVVGGQRSSLTLQGAESGRTYMFRVIVTRNSDGKYTVSDRIRAADASAASASAQDNTSTHVATGYTGGASGAGVQASPPVTITSGGGQALEPLDLGEGSLSLTLSTGGPIFVGGRLEVIPGVSGGQWTWDDEIFHSQFDENAVFFARTPGVTTITYTAEGETLTAEIEILPAILPATGQSLTPVLLLAGAGVLLLLAGLCWHLYLTRRERAHGE